MRERIKELIAQTLGVETTDIDEENLLRKNFVGGHELTEILAEIKNEFGMEIPQEDVATVETVGEFIDLIESYVHEEL